MAPPRKNQNFDLRLARSPGEEPPHGTRARYVWSYDPCHCDACRGATNARMRVTTNSLRRRLATADVEHGKLSTYTNWGCRCDACTAVHSTYCRDYNQQRKANR